jgi:dinuclear metal center YbgI/SA1388 family protein
MKPIAEIIQSLEVRAPSTTSESWDNTGLLLGDPEWKTPGAVVSVDLTAPSIETALKKKYRLIVNHHPCIFPRQKGLSRITPPSLVYEALSNGIAVASYHTNFDQCALEVVQTIAHALGCEPRGRLIDKPEDSLLKLVVFVPENHLNDVRSAICEAGAGKIGNYDYCAFGTQGEGTFRGNDSTRPAIGKPGKLERVREVRLETIIPRGLKGQVLRSLFDSHPYEEVAYDLYSVEQGPTGHGLVRGMGYGFWGEFKSPKPFSALAKDVRSLFNLDGFFLTDPPPSRVKRIAFAAGKGSSFIGAARSAGCDLFITGEAGYHDALDGSRKGMAVMELGHRESERFFLTTMEGWLVEAGIRATALNIPTQKIITS